MTTLPTTKQSKLYISGPMSGLPKFNFEAFEKAAKKLEELGHPYINPHDLDKDEPIAGVDGYNDAYYVILKRDIKHLMTCDGVLLLKGWEESKGARLEVATAVELKMPLYRLEGDKLVRVHVRTNVGIFSEPRSSYWKE